jgi:uncharacterized protein YlzI (FlbEa/FlbD family)
LIVVGHITIVGEDREEVVQKVLQIKESISVFAAAAPPPP